MGDSCDLIVCCTRICPRIPPSAASGRSALEHGRTHLQWPPATLKVFVEQLLDPVPVRPRCLRSFHARLDPPMPTQRMHLAHPPRTFFIVALRPKQALEELALARHRLVQPGEHVADVADGVVGVQLDGSWQAVRTAAREGVEEEVENRDRAGCAEDGEDLTVGLSSAPASAKEGIERTTTSLVGSSAARPLLAQSPTPRGRPWRTHALRT